MTQKQNLLSRCSNCKNFTQRTKRTGTCLIHKKQVINLKKGIKQDRLLTVFKYNLCEKYDKSNVDLAKKDKKSI